MQVPTGKPQSNLAALAALTSVALGVPALAGDLRIYPIEKTVCSHSGVLFQGQDVRLIASNIPPGSLVKVRFSYRSEQDETDYDPVVVHEGVANSERTLEAVVTIPSGFTTPALGYLETTGESIDSWANALFTVANEDIVGSDSDGDGVPDVCDNCPEIANADQANSDIRGGGDACDPCPRDSEDDSDGDGLCGDVDEFPFDPDNDVDGDGREGKWDDNCPDVYNPAQLDRDSNGIGDACQSAPTCSDGIDNDEDGFTDFPADKGCADAEDTRETSPDLPCDDGLDNDADALVDYFPEKLGDPGCGPDTSKPENPECDDGIDNDGDGTLDWDGSLSGTPDPDCKGVGYHASES